MQDVFGNTLGLKPSQLHALRRTYRRRVDARSIISPELARHLCEVSAETNRLIGVLLDRKGDVHAVIVGDARRLERLDLVAALEVRPGGLPGKVHWAHLLPENPQGAMWKDEASPDVHELGWDPL